MIFPKNDAKIQGNPWGEREVNNIGGVLDCKLNRKKTDTGSAIDHISDDDVISTLKDNGGMETSLAENIVGDGANRASRGHDDEWRIRKLVDRDRGKALPGISFACTPGKRVERRDTEDDLFAKKRHIVKLGGFRVKTRSERAGDTAVSYHFF